MRVVASIYGFSFLAAWCIQKAQTMRLVVVVVAAGAKEPVADVYQRKQDRGWQGWQGWRKTAGRLGKLGSWQRTTQKPNDE